MALVIFRISIWLFDVIKKWMYMVITWSILLLLNNEDRWWNLMPSKHNNRIKRTLHPRMCCLRLTNVKHSKNYFARERTEATAITHKSKLRNEIFTTYKKNFKCEISFLFFRLRNYKKLFEFKNNQFWKLKQKLF